MDRNNKIKELEDLLMIYDEIIEDFKQEKLENELLTKIRLRRQFLITQINLLGGPLVKEKNNEKNREVCYFVKRSSW